jgi:hypothetical protein
MITCLFILPSAFLALNMIEFLSPSFELDDKFQGAVNIKLTLEYEL